MKTQAEACRAAAKRLKVKVVAELVEAPSTSGYRNRGRSRPKFQELLELIRTRQVDCVVAYKTDRLSRGGGPGWAPLVEAFEAAGRDPDRVVATTDGWVSEFEIGIRSTMDREESKKTSDRMLAVRRQEAKSGVPRIAGRRAFGYARDLSEIVTEEAALIEEAAERVLAGESIWSICGDWNTRSVATVTGRPWQVQTLTNILRSGRIAGLREHKGAVVADGKWPAIISKDLHDELVAALAPKRKVGGRARTYPLVGLLRCGKCGGPLRSLAREGGGRSYACRSGPGLDGCGGIRIQAKGVEHHMCNLVCGMLADPDTRAALPALGDDGDNNRRIVEELRAVENKRQRLIDLYTDGDIDRAEFRRRRDDLDERASALEAEVAQRSGNRVLADVPAGFDDLVETWEVRGVEFQRRLTEALLLPITVQPAGTRRRTFDPGRLKIRPAPEQHDHTRQYLHRRQRRSQAETPTKLPSRHDPGCNAARLDAARWSAARDGSLKVAMPNKARQRRGISRRVKRIACPAAPLLSRERSRSRPASVRTPGDQRVLTPKRGDALAGQFRAVSTRVAVAGASRLTTVRDTAGSRRGTCKGLSEGWGGRGTRAS